MPLKFVTTESLLLFSGKDSNKRVETTLFFNFITEQLRELGKFYTKGKVGTEELDNEMMNLEK